MVKRRGNPNWGKPQDAAAVNVPPTSFEEIVKTLRLRHTDYLRSQPLKDWLGRIRIGSTFRWIFLKPGTLKLKVTRFKFAAAVSLSAACS
jgi:hypothetical protein